MALSCSKIIICINKAWLFISIVWFVFIRLEQKICENKDVCGVLMSSEDTKI